MQSLRPVNGTESWVIIRRALAQRARRYSDAEDETAADDAFVKAVAAVLFRFLKHPSGSAEGAWMLCSERRQLIICLMEAFRTIVSLCKEHSSAAEPRPPLLMDPPLREAWRVLISLVLYLHEAMTVPDQGVLAPFLERLLTAVHDVDGAMLLPDLDRWLDMQMQRFDHVASPLTSAPSCLRSLGSPSASVHNRDLMRLPPIRIPGGRIEGFDERPRSIIRMFANRNNLEFRTARATLEPEPQRSRSPQLVPTSSTLHAATGSTEAQMLGAPATESEILQGSLLPSSDQQPQSADYEQMHDAARLDLGQGLPLLPLTPNLELLDELPAMDVDDPVPPPPVPQPAPKIHAEETPPRHIKLTYIAPRISPSPTVVVPATETSPAHVDFSTVSSFQRLLSGSRRRPPGINAADLARQEAEPTAAQVVPAASAPTSPSKVSDTPGPSAPPASAPASDAAGEDAALRAISAIFVRDMLATPPAFARIGLKATPLPEHVLHFIQRSSGRL